MKYLLCLIKIKFNKLFFVEKIIIAKYFFCMLIAMFIQIISKLHVKWLHGIIPKPWI